MPPVSPCKIICQIPVAQKAARWYHAAVFFKRHSTGVLHRIAQCTRLAVAFCLFALTVLHGLTFCLCDPDPDGCGEHCHDCGTPPPPSETHLEHVCDHLILDGPPPGEPVPSAVKELNGLLLALAAMPPPACVPILPPTAPRCRTNRPPGIPAPQLIFIAHATQFLC